VSSRRILGQTALVFCVGAIAAPAAQAMFPDYGPIPQPNKRPIVIDRRPIVIESSGLDWADAGIGAATAAGLMLVGGGTVLLVRRGQRAQLIDAKGQK
jgi:hypothetical protein